MQVLPRPKRQSQGHPKDVIPIQFTYTRDNRAYRDIAIDHLKAYLATNGVIPGISGLPSRPHSDSFEDSLPFFNSKLLPSISDNNPLDTRPDSARDISSIKLNDAMGPFGNQSAWENLRPMRPSSVSEDQRERMLAELPEYLRGEYFRHTVSQGSQGSRMGDRQSMYGDSALDFDPSNPSFSRVVGSRPRSEVAGYPVNISPSKRYSGDSGTYSSNSSLWEQPISRPSTSGGRSDTWATVSGLRQDTETRKAWNSAFSTEKRIGAF